MEFPRFPNHDLVDQIYFQAQRKADSGAVEQVNELLAELGDAYASVAERLAALSGSADVEANEPDDLAGIRALRPEGPRALGGALDDDTYSEKVEGALIARMAGCTLGTIVEGWSVEDTEKWAAEIGVAYPPTDYWPIVKCPTNPRYFLQRRQEYARDTMDGVPLDDDTVYTIMGLLVLERHGLEFEPAYVADMWHELLPWVWKDAQWPLDRYLSGVPAERAADDSPYAEQIGASTRCDTFGYVAPGLPEVAAGLAYKEASMSHRRTGVYASMFFAAAMAAAFVVDDPVEALEIGLTEIPADCRFASDMRWALDAGTGIHNYREGRQAVDDRFGTDTWPHGPQVYYHWHATSNACLTVFGLMVGGTDVTKVISETMAMGLDNDCTPATAGSIVGAIVGKQAIPPHWYRNFNDKVHSYIKGQRYFSISDLVERYLAQSHKVSRRYRA